MKHHMFAAALGGLALALVAPATPSFAAPDPTGIWSNDDGSAKMEVKKCGQSLCSKIVWLRDPADSRGKPLHDARNEDVAMRARPIIGMPLFIGMNPVEPGVWVGSVYNPEEGHVYTQVKVTVASRSQIVLRGCKAWLLCGEKSWTRSALPPGFEQANAAPVVKPQAPVQESQDAVSPGARPSDDDAAGVADAAPNASNDDVADATQSLPRSHAPSLSEMAPSLPAPSQDAVHGYGFITTTAIPDSPPPLSGQNVSTLFVMTPVALQGADEQMAAATPASLHAKAGKEPRTALPMAAAKPRPAAAPRTQDADAADVLPKRPSKSAAQVQEEQNEAELPWMQRP